MGTVSVGFRRLDRGGSLCKKFVTGFVFCLNKNVAGAGNVGKDKTQNANFGLVDKELIALLRVDTKHSKKS